MTYSTVTTSHKWLNIPDDTLGLYNYLDCLATAKLAEAFPQILKEHSNWETWQNEIKPLIEPSISMSLRGLPVDRASLTSYKTSLTKQLAECDNFVREFADDWDFPYTETFPNSGPQVASLLYETLGFRCKKRTDSGAPSVDQEALSRLLRDLLKREKPYLPLLHALFHRSRLQTIKERYLNFTISPDNRVRPRVKLFGTKTMRYAYENPPLQQWPKEIRHIISTTGTPNVIVSADYEQLEARIFAYMASETRDITAFEKGWDVHSLLAADIFDLPMPKFETWNKQQWTDFKQTHKDERDFAKTFRYGKMYGGSADTMKTKLFCPCERWGCAAKSDTPKTQSRAQALKAEARWAATRGKSEQFFTALVSKTRQTNYYTTVFGFRRYFLKPWNTGEAERELRNFPIQYTAATIINRAQVKLHAEGCPIIMQNHDELTIETPKQFAPHWVKRMRLHMEAPVPELGNVSFPVSINVGETWT